MRENTSLGALVLLLAKKENPSNYLVMLRGHIIFELIFVVGVNSIPMMTKVLASSGSIRVQKHKLSHIYIYNYLFELLFHI